MILLDTSFLVQSLARGSDADSRLRSWLREGVPVATSAIAWTEFACGPLRDGEQLLLRRIVKDVVPFVEGDAAVAAELFNLASRRHGAMADCMIAASALRHDAALATAHSADFKVMEPAGLRIVAR